MVGKKDVLHIASLARIRLSDQEAEDFVAKLEPIFEHVETIQAVDTSAVKDGFHASGLKNIFREDLVEDPAEHPGEMVKLAADHSGTFIRTPIVVGKSEGEIS
jgi:aspartyl-tRNA(Asn)/glutamyl-tRNA(Gln) amidotransferase subunit C